MRVLLLPALLASALLALHPLALALHVLSCANPECHCAVNAENGKPQGHSAKHQHDGQRHHDSSTCPTCQMIWLLTKSTATLAGNGVSLGVYTWASFVRQIQPHYAGPCFKLQCLARGPPYLTPSRPQG